MRSDWWWWCGGGGGGVVVESTERKCGWVEWGLERGWIGWVRATSPARKRENTVSPQPTAGRWAAGLAGYSPQSFATLSPKKRSALHSSFLLLSAILSVVLFLSFRLLSLCSRNHGPPLLKPLRSQEIIPLLHLHPPHCSTSVSEISPSDKPKSCENCWARAVKAATMNHMGSPPFIPADQSSTKRKRSLSGDELHRQPTPPAKFPKTNANHLQINYLARQYQEILPLISPEDALPSLLSLISDYDGVLHRHESMAGNLGARPLGPILIQRFERIFDGPPRVLKTHGKEGTSVGWLDVVEFARNKPEQFNLEKMREGNRVCQFYTKQCRVEISEEDYLLIKSGMPEKLIPPQPIGEDEEKELGTLEILEKNLGGVVHLADQG